MPDAPKTGYHARMRHILAGACATLAATVALADAPQIVDAKAVPTGGVWRFSVTLAHPDTGWDHYADGWRIELDDGTILGTRELLHPHVTEQPFTRSLAGVSVPTGVTLVVVRARDNVDAWATETFRLQLSD